MIPQGYLDPAEELLPELLAHRDRFRQMAVDDENDARADDFELITLEVRENAPSDSDRERKACPVCHRAFR